LALRKRLGFGVCPRQPAIELGDAGPLVEEDLPILQSVNRPRALYATAALAASIRVDIGCFGFLVNRDQKCIAIRPAIAVVARHWHPLRVT